MRIEGIGVFGCCIYVFSFLLKTKENNKIWLKFNIYGDLKSRLFKKKPIEKNQRRKRKEEGKEEKEKN